jgi:hypothetical protein
MSVFKQFKNDSYSRIILLILFSSLPYLFCYELFRKKQVFKIFFQPGLTKIQVLFYGQ